MDAAELPLFFVFGQNYSPDTLLKLNAATWTLAVEVAFYLMLPVIGLLALRLGRAACGAQALLLGGLVIAGLGWNLADYLARLGTCRRPRAAVVPAVLRLRHARRARGRVARARRRAGVSGRASAAARGSGRRRCSSRTGSGTRLDRSPVSFAMEVFADIGAAVAFAAIIAAIVLGTGAGLRWLAWRPLAWIGTITYGLYLWHIPLIVWARGHGLLPGGALSARRRAARRDRARRRQLVPARAAVHATCGAPAASAQAA